MKQKTSLHYIAYFDILGYKAIFEDEETDILSFLKNIVKLANDVLHSVSPQGYLGEKFHVKTFSDNFIILLEASNRDEYQAIKSMGYLLAILQLRFLKKYSILVRGGITKGEAYFNNNIVFGEGLIRAVEIENLANHPRIIIDEARISRETCFDLTEKCLIQDEDEKYYVNYYHVLGMGVGDSDEFAFNEEEQLMIIKNNIVKLIKKFGKYKQNVKDNQKISLMERRISKYFWLVTKHNEYCNIYWDEQFQIPIKVSLNKKLMKCELIMREKDDRD